MKERERPSFRGLLDDSEYAKPENSWEQVVLADLGGRCGALAGSIIRLDRSGRNRQEGEGLLFQQLANWRRLGETNTWRCGSEFFEGHRGSWGVTGEALFFRRDVHVTEIQSDSREQWSGLRRGERVNIKPRYCDAIGQHMGSRLREMLVVPIQSNGIIVGAIKLFNHGSHGGCAGEKFSDTDLDDVRTTAEVIAEWWLKTRPVRCDIVAIYIDVVGSTSFLLASGYYDGARVFQIFTDLVKEEVDNVGEAIRRRFPDSLEKAFGGIPFLDKFTGDGVLVLFPYDRTLLRRNDYPEGAHIGPDIRRVIEAAVKGWESVLNRPECRRVLREAAMDAARLRVAISSGPAYLGRFGEALSALGRPLIEGARIIALSKLYDEYFADERVGTCILVSEQFKRDFKLHEASRTQKDYELRGLPGQRTVYRIRLEQLQWSKEEDDESASHV